MLVSVSEVSTLATRQGVSFRGIPSGKGCCEGGVVKNRCVSVVNRLKRMLSFRITYSSAHPPPPLGGNGIVEVE